MVETATLARRATLQRRGVRLEQFTVGWNVLEAGIAIAAGLAAGSVALIGFGVDSGIEVVSASALLWRFRKAGAEATGDQHSHAERRALFVVATTFFLLAAYIGFESIRALVTHEGPDQTTVGLTLAIVSLAIMPALAYGKQRTADELGSRALRADAVESWVCSYLSLALLCGVGLHTAFEWWWADAVGALAMLPVIIWQGWETLEDARRSSVPRVRSQHAREREQR